MRRVKDAVPLEEAKRRALEYLQKSGYPYQKASMVAGAIWPDTVFHSQGGGAAASRILKALEREGKVKWSSNGRKDWGWGATECHN